MNFQISLALLLAASVISFQDENGGDYKTARKHYGLSFHSKCRDYVKSFTCMTTCKSIGFQIFRMDFRCKCSCHGLKTTTILPFFKWHTNGTTKSLPRTQSPQLYHVAGTLSPTRTQTEATETEETSTPLANVTCIPPEPTTLTASDDDVSGNTTGMTTDGADGGDTTSNPDNEGGPTTGDSEADTTTTIRQQVPDLTDTTLNSDAANGNSELTNQPGGTTEQIA